MSDLEFILGFALAALLTGFLCLKVRRRLLTHSEHHDYVERIGKGIDTSELQHTLDAVRKDYEAARPKPKGLCFHRALVGLARRAVAQLAYFQHKDPAQENRS